MIEPKISIITVSYNAVSTIEETILSVIKQSYVNIEYIIIDGGSTDGTLDIIKKYQSKISYWVSEHDNGIYDAMNKGIAYATGDWIYFLGADDLLVRDIINKVYPYLNLKQGIVYGNVYMIGKQKKYDGKLSSLMLVTRNIPHQATFYSKKIFCNYSYNLEYVYLADYYLNLQCWKDPNIVFKYIPLTIAIYNDTSVSSVEIDRCFESRRGRLMLHNLPIWTAPYILYRRLRHIIKIILLNK